LPEGGAVAIQVSVTGPDEDGRREISIHSRPEGDREEGLSEWACHARGVLSTQTPSAPEPLDTWPPEGAEPIEVDHLYDVLAEHGLEYGPAFQGLTSAWREGEAIWVEASLPEVQALEAERFGIHPALLAAALSGIGPLSSGPSEPKLPFSWDGVSLHAVGAKELRVKIVPAAEDGVSLVIVDGTGAPVATVDALVSRSLDPAQLRIATQKQEGLLGLEWTELTLTELDEAPPEVELLRCETDPELPAPDGARKATLSALEAIQTWLADESKADSRLALITEGAAATGKEAPDPAAAAIWGLIRSAQSEHPGRFALIDMDGSEASETSLSAALALGEAEPQLALREGAALAPRLVRTKGGEEEKEAAIDPERTVLITGGTGGLGALIARRLTEHHGAKHLLLVSRSGSKAEGAKELKAELKGLGAKARIAACDVSDPKALEKLLASIPKTHPLGAVVHCAGTIADATVQALAPEQVEEVFAPKAQGAWNLHELTAEAGLSAFVLFSSAAGTLGGAGQANYSAANVFLDALAQKRCTEGRPATSIAWGLWERWGGMASGLTEADLARMQRGGIKTLTDGQGLEFFDTAICATRPMTLAIPLNFAGLRSLASVGVLPPIFSSLVRTSKRRIAASGSLAAKLATLPEAEHEAHVLDLVRSQVAAVLGHGSAQEIEPDRAFQEMGFDSLAAVELRNRLDAIAGLRLAATVVFDYPSSAALAERLLAAIEKDGKPSVAAGLNQLELTLATLPTDDPGRSKLAAHLRSLAADLEGDDRTETRASDLSRLESASDEELLDFIDEQVGST
jgi:NAD(P)-dependent dehydrogenase (short-subunit alcohol dehydrogenase family)